MELFGNELVAKSGTQTTNKYYCSCCHYTCFKKYNWDKHLITAKHKKHSPEIECGNKWQNSGNEFECEFCNRLYATSSGLWKHKKTCIKSIEPEIINKEPTDKDLIMMLIKENSELKTMMMKVLENGTHNTMINNTNSHNKAFNLQFFLNETCKDAMNITEFVESIKLQLFDFENVGDVGFVNGISNIIIKNLKALDITKRPVHCTDQKRETIYIKDDNKWEKEDDKNQKLRKFIKKVVSKNHRLILKSSPTSTRYDKIIIEAMGGAGDNDIEKEDKIIRNIVKNIVIDK